MTHLRMDSRFHGSMYTQLADTLTQLRQDSLWDIISAIAVTARQLKPEQKSESRKQDSNLSS